MDVNVAKVVVRFEGKGLRRERGRRRQDDDQKAKDTQMGPSLSFVPPSCSTLYMTRASEAAASSSLAQTPSPTDPRDRRI